MFRLLVTFFRITDNHLAVKYIPFEYCEITVLKIKPVENAVSIVDNAGVFHIWKEYPLIHYYFNLNICY